MKALIEAELFRQIQYERQRITRRRGARAPVDALVIRPTSVDARGRLERQRY